MNTQEVPLEDFPHPQNDDFYAQSIYTHLDTTKDEIRLVRVLPGNPEDPIKCELVQNISLLSLQKERPEVTDYMSFENSKREVFRSQDNRFYGTELGLGGLGHEDCLQQGYTGIMQCEVQEWHLAGKKNNNQSPLGDEYYALSYAAGNLQDLTPITLGGVVFNVYSSIAEAIRRLRLSSITLQLWIDQICINQSNGTEKNMQVSKMKDIYRKANEVLIWLGNSHDNNETSIKSHLEFIGHQYFFLRYFEHFPVDEMDSLDKERAKLKAFLATLQSPRLQQISSMMKPQSVALRDLLEWSSLSWFRRCWTLQEVAVAYKATFIYGSEFWSRELQLRAIHALLYVWLAHGMASFDLHGAMPEWCFDILSPFRSFQYLFGYETEFRSIKLSAALDLSRKAQCTDPRDHVYCVLGLIGQDYGIRPDYRRSNSSGDVFTEATKAIIEHEGCLDILARGSEIWRHESPCRLPSWVPDFSRIPDAKLPDAHLPNRSEQRYIPDPRLRFSADAAGHPSAILECSGRVLSALAPSPAALGEVGAAPDEVSTPAFLDNWRSCITHSGIDYIYSPTQEVAALALYSAMFLGDPATTMAGYHTVAHTLAVQETMRLGVWRFFVSPGGYMGFAPAHVRSDDLLILLVNCSVVLVVREIGTGPGRGYHLLGPAYLHGFDIDKEFQDKIRDPAEISALQTIRLI